MSGRWEGIPVLDYDRATETRDGQREVIRDHGPLTVHVDEVEQFVNLPVRTTCGPVIGPTLEVGPYSLTQDDARQLLAHLTAFLTTFRTVPQEGGQ